MRTVPLLARLDPMARSPVAADKRAARIAQGLERDGLDARVDDRMVEDLDAALVGVSLRAGPDLEPALGRLRDDLRGSRGRSLREVISEVR